LSLTEEQVDELVEELVRLRSGKPFHIHADLKTGGRKFCSSPYCVDLTYEGVKEGPNA